MRLLLLPLLFASFLYSQNGILNVSWPILNIEHQKPSVPYPLILTNSIKNTKLPVYIPSSYVYDKQMIVVSDENFYTISFFIKNATIMIAGDRTFQETISNSDMELQRLLKTSSLEFIQEEGIMNIDFNRHGVNYTLSIECNNPREDKRCTEENFLYKIYNKLIIVGGKK